MPASLSTLYKVEEAVESGLVSILNAETGIDCFSTFSTEELTTPRIEIVCSLGESTGHYATPTIDGSQRECLDAWECSVLLRYVTNVSARGEAAAQHSTARAKIRLAMAVWRGLFDATAFPYHQLGRPLDAGTNVDVNNDEDFDSSELTFNSLVNIREDAWPATSDE